MEGEESVSTLPWSWVIEALAKSELVDVKVLYELVSKAPPLIGDSGKRAREAAALRCLEGLFSPSDVSSENCDISEIVIDPTESCESTLQRILSETSGPKGASAELKRVIQSFVKHKKASLSKSTLEFLKDIIPEDTHPLAATLRELGGFVVRDQCVLNVPFDGGDPTSPPLRSDEDDHVDKTMLAEESGYFLRSGIDNQPVEAYPNEACRGSISNQHTDKHVLEIGAISHDMDHQCPPGKKCKIGKEYDNQAMQEDLVPVGSNQMCNGAGNGPNHVRFHDGKSHIYVDGHDKKYMENNDEQQISPNNGDQCREEINLAMKKPNLLSSQCEVLGAPFANIDTEPNLCMKCSKEDNLLSCSASSCPLLFHESCLGSSASLDDQGNFYCPFCAYSRAISEYVKAKKKVSLRRKELSLFIGGKAGDQLEHDGNSSSRDDVNQDKNGERRAEAENDATGRHKDSDESSKDDANRIKNKNGEKRARVEKGANDRLKDGDESSKDDANRVRNKNNEKRARVEKGANDRHQDGDKTAELRECATVVAQVAKPPLSSLRSKQVECSHSSAYMGVNGFVISAQRHFSVKSREGAELVIQLSTDPCQIWSHRQYDGVNLSSDNELLNHRKSTKCKITELHGDTSSESISNSDELRQDSRNNDVSCLQFPKPLRTMPSSPQGRRKKIPWTPEEEAMLKKGVEKFAQQDQTIPWKCILEYGGSVFQKGRTPVDLKDKWRNMTRGSSPRVK